MTWKRVLARIGGQKAAQSETVSGQTNVKAALCYLLGWLTGLAFLLIERKDRQVRFHAAQATVTFGALTLISLFPVIGWLLSPLLMLIGFLLWLVLMLKAYRGQKVVLPVFGNWAKKLAGEK